MVKKQKSRKTSYTRSIYIPEEDFDIDKELHETAKEDEGIEQSIRDRKSGLVSHITIKLWKQYIKIQKRLKDESDNPNS